ncbi:MAG: CTD-interacting factor [Schleiferiaceae bacterium]|nr:CTD-interacting factor [Schleiferiaceae bacterium]
MPHPFTSALELWKEYSFWQTSQQILKRSIAQVMPAEPSLAAAALENALMRQMIGQSPEPETLFNGLDEELIQYGFDCVEAPLPENGARAILQVVREELQQYTNLPMDRAFPTLEVTPEAFRLGQYSLKRIPPIEKAYQVLLRQHEENQAQTLLLRARLRYAALYAETRHIGPPQVVYDHFYDCGVRNEGFASPFNARLLGKENARFYSLFPETDAPFGSGGSFFQLQTPHHPGHWCLDPPFLPETMQQVDKIISQWQKEYPDRAILLVIPESHIPANTPDETVRLEAGKHYYEGLHHSLHPLPVNVCVHRYGNLPGFSAEVIKKGYLPEDVPS